MSIVELLDNFDIAIWLKLFSIVSHDEVDVRFDGENFGI
jgi:hypothetical protein